MSNRSNINLVGNTTSGQNIGTGLGIFKCKSSGNNLLFKTICGAGSISIITGDTIIIYGTSSTGGTGGIAFVLAHQ